MFVRTSVRGQYNAYALKINIFNFNRNSYHKTVAVIFLSF